MLEKAEKELKTEFIPELYDKTMGKMFDDKYYEMSDGEGEAFDEDKEKQLTMKLINDEDLNKKNEENEDMDEELKEEIYETELAKPLRK